VKRVALGALHGWKEDEPMARWENRQAMDLLEITIDKKRPIDSTGKVC
jgi:hypothetical protein